MNRDQLLNWLIRNGSSSADQLIDWSRRGEYTMEMAKFLLEMQFDFSKCDHCGEPIYEGDISGWLDLTGTEPEQSTIHTVNITSCHQPDQMDRSYDLCDPCFIKLAHFLGEI